MSDKKIVDENVDEIIKNVVKGVKKGKEFSEQEVDKLMLEANENLEFVKIINDIKLELPDNRVIFNDGNEQLLYDHGEFFICETTDSRKPKKKIKRKDATEKYIEYFIRYQLNPIIEQKKLHNMTQAIEKSDIIKPEKVKAKVKSVPSKKPKVKDDLAR